jgi:hypothetical protein
LIEGIVYMPSPVRAAQHGEPHAQIAVWLGLYAIESTGVRLFDNASVRLDLDNEPQPDLALLSDIQAFVLVLCVLGAGASWRVCADYEGNNAKAQRRQDAKKHGEKESGAILYPSFFNQFKF